MPGRPGVWSFFGWDHGRADKRPNRCGQNRIQGTGKYGNRALLALSGGLQPDLYAFETLVGSRLPTAGHPERTTGILLSPTTGVLTRARVAVHRGERAGLDQDYTPDAPVGGREKFRDSSEFPPSSHSRFTAPLPHRTFSVVPRGIRDSRDRRMPFVQAVWTRGDTGHSRHGRDPQPACDAGRGWMGSAGAASRRPSFLLESGLSEVS
jgi:hypothetical protein